MVVSNVVARLYWLRALCKVWFQMFYRKIIPKSFGKRFPIMSNIFFHMGGSSTNSVPNLRDTSARLIISKLECLLNNLYPQNDEFMSKRLREEDISDSVVDMEYVESILALEEEFSL